MIKPWAKRRILDLSQGIAGPYCAQIMASQGARVIKVEPPSGDWSRFIGVTKADHSGMSIQYNQGKQGVALDAKHPLGRELLAEMVAACDVVIQNFRPGVAQRLGIDYSTLVKARPDIICVSITGYDSTGPFSGKPATDSVMQADTGMMFMNRTADGTPRKVGMPVIDAVTGLYASQALSAALFHRQTTGEGAHVEVSLFDACLAFQGMPMIEYTIAGATPDQSVSAPNGVFNTADGQLMIVALNADQFGRLCRALDSEHWLEDERFATNQSRLQHRDLLAHSINAVLSHADTEYWLDKLSQHEVLHARLRDYQRVYEHPQISHNDPFEQHDVNRVGTIKAISSPLTLFRHSVSASPSIGEHTVKVLTEMGIAQDRIEDLLAQGVIHQPEYVS